jgi:hypothetical protein
MAVFNPEQPGQDPNYLNYSKSATAPAANQRGEFVGKAIGEAVGGLAEIADKFVKTSAKNEAAEGSDAIQDIFTQILKTQTPDPSVIPQPVQTVGAAGQSVRITPDQKSLMDANAQADIPDGVDDGISRIQTISNARDGGKINDTYYTAQLTALAKNLRTKYPGYRDYIDEEIHHITGINPAKEYITNLMQDINAGRTAAQKFPDMVLKELMSANAAGTPGAVDAIAHFQSTGDTAGALKWINAVKSNTYKIGEIEQGLTLDKNSDEQVGRKLEKAFTLKGESEVNAAWSAASMRANVDTPAQIEKMVNDKAVGVGGRIDSSKMQAAALNIAAQRAEMESRLIAMGQQPLRYKKSDGSIATTSYEAAMGSEKFNALKTNLLRRYDVVKDSITNDKTGTAVFTATVNQRVRADLDNAVITDPANKQLNMIDWMNTHTGPNWTNLVTTQALKADVDVVFKNLLANKTIAAAAGPIPGQPVPSFKDDVADAKDGRVTSDGRPVPPETRYFDRLLDNINLLATPAKNKEELEGKKNIAEYFFNPRNRGTLSNFELDVWDSQNRKIPGRESIFNVFTNPAVVKGVKETQDPNIQKNYKDLLEYEFGQKIFSETIHSVNDILQGQALPNTTAKLGEIHLGWDNDEKGPRVLLLDGKNREVTRAATPIEQTYLSSVKHHLDDMNVGIKQLAGVQKEFGGDVNSYLIGVLEHSGMTSIASQQMLKAIATSRQNLEGKTGLKFTPPAEEGRSKERPAGAGNIGGSPTFGIP